MAMTTAMAADVWVFCLNQFTTAPTAKIRVFDDGVVHAWVGHKVTFLTLP
jgi:hypothetical protein